MVGRAVGDWPLVGRAREIDGVHGGLARADVDAVLVVGEAGVGKSRLASESLGVGQQLGFRCLQVLATRAASGVPLGALAWLLPAEPGWAHADDGLDWVVDQLRGEADRLLVVVDDAHLLDEASAKVLHNVVRAGRDRLLLTTRSETLGVQVTSTLVGSLRCEQVDVGSLSRAHTVELVESMLGGPVDGPCAHELWAASRGNPLFLRELVLGARTSGQLRVEAGLWRLSGRLATTARLVEMIGVRLADLEAGQRVALELLAMGEPLRLDVLADLGVDPSIVDDLEALGWVDASAARRAGARLAHPLYGEILRSQLTVIIRVAISRRLAEAFEAGSVGENDVLRVALWRIEGGGAVDPALMLDGARRAYFARETELAERLAREAIAAGTRLEAGVLLAQVLGNQGRHEERYELLGQLALAASSDEERALVAMERALTAFWGLNCGTQAGEDLAAVERSLPAGPWRDEVTAQGATLEFFSGRLRRALAVAAPLLKQPPGRPMVTAAIAAAPALALCGRGDEAVALADRAFAAHAGLGEQEVMSSAGVHVIARAFGLTESGRLSDAAVTLHVAYDVSVALRDPVGQAWSAMLRGQLGLVTGQVGAAARWFREAAAGFARLGQDGPRRWCLAGAAMAQAQHADHEAAERMLAELDALGPNCMQIFEPEVMQARAWGAVARADMDGARRGLAAAAASAEAMGASALAAAAWHDLARVGDAETAAARLARIVPHVEGELIPARAAHAQALAADDIAGLAAAADRFEAIGALLLAAEAAVGGAAACRRAGRSQRSVAMARRARQLHARCPEARTPTLAMLGWAADLTRREREVAVLAARGMSSRAIGDRLHVSVRTVESHLQAVYGKLGISSRDELATTLDP